MPIYIKRWVPSYNFVTCIIINRSHAIDYPLYLVIADRTRPDARDEVLPDYHPALFNRREESFLIQGSHVNSLWRMALTVLILKWGIKGRQKVLQFPSLPRHTGRPHKPTSTSLSSFFSTNLPRACHHSLKVVSHLIGCVTEMRRMAIGFPTSLVATAAEPLHVKLIGETASFWSQEWLQAWERHRNNVKPTLGPDHTDIQYWRIWDASSPSLRANFDCNMLFCNSFSSTNSLGNFNLQPQDQWQLGT